MKFKRTPNIDYKPQKQKQVDYSSVEKQLPDPDPSVQNKSRADIIAEEYDRTIQFLDFLIDNVDEKIKDVVISVDPDQNPEVWMAMKRLYGNTAQQFLSGKNYSEALNALHEISSLELEESKQDNTALEDEIIDAIKQASQYGETTDAEAPEMDVATEDDRAIAEAMEDRRLVVGDNSKPKPPSWWQRFRRTFTRKKVIQFVNGQRTEVGVLKQGLTQKIEDNKLTKTTTDFRNK